MQYIWWWCKKRILKKTITILLESLNGESEEVPKIIEQLPKIIEQLYGKALIFWFKLNDQNLTEGK